MEGRGRVSCLCVVQYIYFEAVYLNLILQYVEEKLLSYITACLFLPHALRNVWASAHSTSGDNGIGMTVHSIKANKWPIPFS